MADRATRPRARVRAIDEIERARVAALGCVGIGAEEHVFEHRQRVFGRMFGGAALLRLAQRKPESNGERDGDGSGGSDAEAVPAQEQPRAIAERARGRADRCGASGRKSSASAATLA
jgi:hypothetical protein